MGKPPTCNSLECFQLGQRRSGSSKLAGSYEDGNAGDVLGTTDDVIWFTGSLDYCETRKQTEECHNEGGKEESVGAFDLQLDGVGQQNCRYLTDAQKNVILTVVAP